MAKKIVIIGGVAGGASAAARARRLSEDSEITVIERGPYVSFANCGLPYHIGGVIQDRDDLLIQTPESLKARFNLNVLINHEAIQIRRDRHEILIKELSSGKELNIPYDTLILSPGAEAFKPPIPGLNLPNVFTLKTLPDMDAIISYLEKIKAGHATVIGGGFIGIEAAENLHLRGLSVSVVERDKQVMPPMDPEMTSLLHQHLKVHGIDLRLGAQVTGITNQGGKTSIQFSEGLPLETDLVILSIGVRPEIKLAKEAGLKIGERGGISVTETMQTTDPDIFAVGDAVECKDTVTNTIGIIPLAGPANRQGRIAADNAFNESKSVYRGTQGTWICKVFDLTAAQTGASEKSLKRINRAFKKVYVHPASHAGYYPGAKQMSIKVLFDSETGTLLGAQIVGSDGVDKRIDVLATAMAGKLTISDLAHLELAYAPPYGSAKDPVNLAGMVGENMQKNLHRAIHVDELSGLKPDSHLLLDVRTIPEHKAGNIPGSSHVPVDELRARRNELPKNREIILYCQVGLRGYVAQRMLTQMGFSCKNLIGGYKTWTMFHEEVLLSNIPPKIESKSSEKTDSSNAGEVIELNACGLQCPGPLLKMRERLKNMNPGQTLKILATDPGFPSDATAWCHHSGDKLVKSLHENGKFIAIIEKTDHGKNEMIPTQASLQQTNQTKNRLTMVVFSNDLDKAYATFIIANGAASMGMEVTLFFTFWGLNILRKKEGPAVEKTPMEKMFGFMMPQGAEALGLSKMHFGGMGTAMMKNIMSQKNVSPLPDLINSLRASGARLVACTMSMDVMGIKKSELIDGIEEGGVASYIDSAADSGINLFI